MHLQVRCGASSTFIFPYFDPTRWKEIRLSGKRLHTSHLASTSARQGAPLARYGVLRCPNGARVGFVSYPSIHRAFLDMLSTPPLSRVGEMT